MFSGTKRICGYFNQAEESSHSAGDLLPEHFGISLPAEIGYGKGLEDRDRNACITPGSIDNYISSVAKNSDPCPILVP